MTKQNEWDVRLSESGFAHGTEPNGFLATSLEYLPPTGTVLCLADREGGNSVFLAHHGYVAIAEECERPYIPYWV